MIHSEPNGVSDALAMSACATDWFIDVDVQGMLTLRGIMASSLLYSTLLITSCTIRVHNKVSSKAVRD